MKVLILLICLVSLLSPSCCVFPKTMFVDSLGDVDTANVKICCVDSTTHQNPKIYVVEYKDK